jgi:hypothetical protein
MAAIVAGRFDTFDQASAVAKHLYTQHFGQEDVTIFFLNPAGQHARFPLGGDVCHQTADIDTTVLREAGAKDIQHPEGIWEDGKWRDFDPLAPLQKEPPS